MKRKPSTSLANYDIGLLIAWYTAVREAHGIEFASISPTDVETASDLSGRAQLKLVVLLHDFEQLDPVVVKDVFYICRFVNQPSIAKWRAKPYTSAFMFLTCH